MLAGIALSEGQMLFVCLILLFLNTLAIIALFSESDQPIPKALWESSRSTNGPLKVSFPGEIEHKHNTGLEAKEGIPVMQNNSDYSAPGAEDTGAEWPVSDRDRQINDLLNEKFWNWWEHKSLNPNETVYCMRWCGEKCCDEARAGDFETLCDSLGEPSTDEVTLVTVGTYDRLQSFGYIAVEWTGPKVLVVYGSDYELEEEEELLTELQEAREKLCPTWSNALVLAYVAHGPDEFSTEENTVLKYPRHPLIPINTLRNVAFDAARTRFVFPVDIDFVPSCSLRRTLKKLLPVLGAIDMGAFVVPQFVAFVCDDKVI
eukprot:Rmarinus@m.25659